MAYAEIMGEEFTRGLFIEFDDRTIVCHARDLYFGSKGLPAERSQHLGVKLLADKDDGKKAARQPVSRKIDDNASLVGLIGKKPTEEHDLLIHIRKGVQKIHDARHLRREEQTDSLRRPFLRDRLNKSLRRSRYVGLLIERQGNDT